MASKIPEAKVRLAFAKAEAYARRMAKQHAQRGRSSYWQEAHDMAEAIALVRDGMGGDVFDCIRAGLEEETPAGDADYGFGGPRC